MYACTKAEIAHFRGVAEGSVDFTRHTLLVGGNNIGKSTVCEALDLVLGPERLFRRPVVDEHDFHCGRYLDKDGNPIEIRIEAIRLCMDLRQTEKLQVVGIFEDAQSFGVQLSHRW